MDLTGKLAVVTGASKGIGLATAQALLQAGAVVAGWSRTKPALEHPNFQHYSCDVRDFNSVQEAYVSTVNRSEMPVSVLINNAGLGIQAALENMELADWQKMMETNVNGLFYCTKLVVPGMKQLQEGHIVNISSIAGTTGIEDMSGYCATKFAVRGLSQSWFKELRPHGIKVTCIYPGSVDTHFFDDIPGMQNARVMMQPKDIASTILHCLQAPPHYHHVDIEVRPLVKAGAVK